MREDLVAAVEALTGGTVDVFLADNGLDPDIAVAIFLMQLSPGETTTLSSA